MRIPALSLASTLRLVSRTEHLDSLTNVNRSRLRQLIEYYNTNNMHSINNEYKVLSRFVNAFLKQNKSMHIVAVEYTFDDGASNQQHGDLLLFDGKCFYTAECKCILQYANPARMKREKKVRDQAYVCRDRLARWLQYLGKIDPRLSAIANCPVKAAIITDKMDEMMLLSNDYPYMYMLYSDILEAFEKEKLDEDNWINHIEYV